MYNLKNKILKKKNQLTMSLASQLLWQPGYVNDILFVTRHEMCCSDRPIRLWLNVEGAYEEVLSVISGIICSKKKKNQDFFLLLIEVIGFILRHLVCVYGVLVDAEAPVNSLGKYVLWKWDINVSESKWICIINRSNTLYVRLERFQNC